MQKVAGGQGLPSSNFFDTNPFNISVIFSTAAKFYILMVQTSNFSVLLLALFISGIHKVPGLKLRVVCHMTRS